MFSFFFKKNCLLCSRNTTELICESCYNQFQKIKPPFCSVCKSYSIENNICQECKKRIPIFESVTTIGIYNGLLKSAIYNLKYDGVQKIAQPLGRFLAMKIKDELNYKEIDLVTSIPISKEKLKKRKFNQAELLAYEVAKNLFIPYKEILEREKDTEAQHSLGKKARSENLKDAFTVSKKTNLKNKNILIVDDIFTTGATIQETASILKKDNCGKIFVGVVARSLI